MSACHHFVLAVAFVAVSSLHAEPEVRRAIPVERSKSLAPKPTPVRKALPAASPTPAAAADITPTPDSNASQFVSIPLLKDLTIEVPGSWWILGADLDAIIKTTAEAILKLANLPTSEGKRTTLFRANSMPQSTYASIAASVVNSPDMTLEEYNAAGESDLHELAQNIAASTEQAGITIISRPTAKKETINGIPAIASSYARQGRKGVTRVETIFLFEAGKQFSITLAYRESEGDFWKPVIAHMRQSIARTASIPASTAAANTTPVPVTAAAPSSASADVVAHKDTTPQSAETSKMPPAPERLRWASHPAGMLKEDDILGVRLAEISTFSSNSLTFTPAPKAPRMPPVSVGSVSMGLEGLTPTTGEETGIEGITQTTGAEMGALTSQVMAERQYLTEEEDDEIPDDAEARRLAHSYSVYQPAQKRLHRGRDRRRRPRGPDRSASAPVRTVLHHQERRGGDGFGVERRAAHRGGAASRHNQRGFAPRRHTLSGLSAAESRMNARCGRLYNFTARMSSSTNASSTGSMTARSNRGRLEEIHRIKIPDCAQTSARTCI